MDQKKKHRKVLRTAFTKGARDLEELLSRPGVELRLIKVSLNILQQKYDDIRLVDSEIYNLLLEEDASEEDLLSEMEGSDGYSRKFSDLSIRCEEVIQVMERGAPSVADGASSHDGTNVSRTGRRKFKLPTLEFKKFDGNIRDWLPFWSQFKKVHDDPDIDPNDKVEYLIQATISGSRARQLVDSFPATGANYSKIVDCLIARFGREDLQIEVYVRELLKLIINNATSGNTAELSILYDRIETQLRALETLGITSDKYAAMLFPLIESCFPPDLLRVWQRLPAENSGSQSELDGGTESTLENRLKSLMRFLKNEVENEQHISLAVEGFGLRPTTDNKDFSQGASYKSKTKKGIVSEIPTAMGLVNTNNIRKCVFCQNSHESANCFKAQNLTFAEKRRFITEKGACLRCLKTGHQSRKCRGRLKCIICSKSHVSLMCPELANNKRETEPTERPDNLNHNVPNADQTLTNRTNTQVFLQTLLVKMENAGSSKFIRALIDTGSQKTYILKSVAHLLGYKSKRQVNIVHGLFGGSELLQRHDLYDVKLRHGSYSCTFEALDQAVICTNVSPVFDGPWMNELAKLNVEIADSDDAAPIELLIGSDIAGKLYTGRRHILECGLVAVETLLGWTLMGKIPVAEGPSVRATTAISLFVKNASVPDLWELDVLGITDPAVQKTRAEMAMATKELFLETVTVNEDKRYEVRLPWLEGHPALPSNYNIAKKRLDSTVKKLKSEDLFESYNLVLKEWQDEKIIEEIPEKDPSRDAHYLPHRPVIKQGNTTTKIRPVFDASAKEKDRPSLNQCLEKGLNLIELIPAILIRFRQNKIGVISDIRKAFLQISVHEADRDFLRFLWVDTNGDQKVYRHTRVVFGISSSPFLLGATIEHHLSEYLKKCESEETSFSKNTIVKLSKSFYVDNCVTSVPSEEALNTFVREASMLMDSGKFDLRGWEFTDQTHEDDAEISTNVLGLNWNKEDDTLSINPEGVSIMAEDLLNQPVTKRLMLSLAQRVFDPIGYTCPVTLFPKLWLQQTWEKGLGWDTPVDSSTAEQLRTWIRELSYLFKIKIPRWIKGGPEEAEDWSLHTFCDASKDAFSAVIFLRVRQGDKVVINLLAAKSRIAPLKKLSIPRLELMAAVIATRLYVTVKENLETSGPSYFWSDSSTVLSWIRRKEEWATFVWNRVKEIREATSMENWRHVPGILNPADLPSRGCSAKKLLKSRWWEGPSWLYQDPSVWPQDTPSYDEEEINQEKRKRLVTTLVNNERSIMSLDEWHLNYFSKYFKTIRMCAWIFRFIRNVKTPENQCKTELTFEEINKAEEFVLKLVQRESFTDENDKRISTLGAFKDQNGVIRLTSRVSNRDDTGPFRFPIVLPAKHPVINLLIFQEHVKSCHVRAQGLMNILREHYWILGGRRSIKSAISGCTVCKRYNAKPFSANAPPLPLDRVRDAVAFEVTGIDFAGPMYLKTGEKAWVCVFTCAVYRAVHFELCTSLSVASFLQALRRFIARRGRPKTIYSDNGTNFVGTENAFSRLDFDKIAEYSCAERIKWRFNPPSAPWWGGFWERLVGVLKQLLRKVLSRASLNYEDLVTVICDCESVINSRPLTYMSSDSSELIPLSPSMFLRDSVDDGVPDCDEVDKATLCRKILHRQKLRDDLRRRFRSEYIGQLKWLQKQSNCRQITVGEVVLIGNDQDKRLDWPIGRVLEMMPGKDGSVRLVKVTTSKGQFLRPIQRLYPLECLDSHWDADAEPRNPAHQEEDGDNMHACEEGTKKAVSAEKQSKSAQMSNGNESLSARVISDAKPGVIKSRVPETRLSVTRSGRQVKIPERFHDFC